KCSRGPPEKRTLIYRMKKYFLYLLAFFLSLYSFHISAQTIPVNDNALKRIYPFVNSISNQISNNKGLESFYGKLLLLKSSGQGVVSIVHIGDSHIQADYLTSIVRNSLQDFFGNAGRGLVFPYQLAQSNSPPDIASSSNVNWEFNRLAHPEIPIASGISGYCIRTDESGASLNLFLKTIDSSSTYSFNRLKFFLDSSTATSWILQAKNNNVPFVIKNEESGNPIFKEVLLEQSSDSFSLSSLPSNDPKEFYGVSLENSKPGIIYHSIGVNGARYDSYNSAPLFWQQLPALKADLYIISLGTNEAQKTDLDKKNFLQQVSQFLENLKSVSPGAAILITTPADDFYKHRRPNIMLKQICASLTGYCTQNRIPLWDLYRISGSYGSAYKWLKRGLMNKDRVHFTNEGYKIQGNLFFNAFAKEYNSYIGNH
ncbi:MAG TPA: SGNH/GDSL hydrolase family protein, partial [Chitinophagaceae bacterium]|nr:SGNH/GDSL hydrolase family protein [Chitinophagaceae bacterium]